MKKIAAIFFVVFMMLGMTACGLDDKETEDKESGEVEVVVFAASSLTETLEEIEKFYKDVDPNVKLVFNFDSSGTLKTQIEEGAVCDVFISAGQKQMDQMDIHADSEIHINGLGFIEEGTRINLLENKVTLVVSEENRKNIQSFDDMYDNLNERSILIGIGNADVPVGQYTQKIFEYFDLDKEMLEDGGCISYGSNVKEVTTQIKEGTVDCGIIYCTDAFSENLQIVDYATPDMCGQAIYPAAVMNTSECKEAAMKFLDYLISEEAMDVFERVGFMPVK